MVLFFFTDFLRGFFAQSTNYCIAMTDTLKDVKTHKRITFVVLMTSLIFRALLKRNANVFNGIFLNRTMTTFPVSAK